jgi:hypothetical protein
VKVHLAAAALGRGKIDLMTQPLKHGDDGPAGARVQRVGETRHEQANTHQSASGSQRYKTRAAA